MWRVISDAQQVLRCPRQFHQRRVAAARRPGARARAQQDSSPPPLVTGSAGGRDTAELHSASVSLKRQKFDLQTTEKWLLPTDERTPHSHQPEVKLLWVCDVIIKVTATLMSSWQKEEIFRKVHGFLNRIGKYLFCTVVLQKMIILAVD